MRKPNKYNNLAVKRPRLAKEWNYEKNYPLVPEDVTGRSGKKVYWKCKKCKNGWLASVDNRSQGKGCPYCSGRSVCNGNCLATIDPVLAMEWDYEKNYPLTPEDVTAHGSKEVVWKCKKCEHNFVMSINARGRGRGCPYCCGQKFCKENSFATVYPELAKEWDYERNNGLTPKDVTKGSDKKFNWACKYGHSFASTIRNRLRGDGCSVCINIKLKDGTVCDSKPEAYYCQTELIDKNIKFKHHIKIGLGKCLCDFYIPSTNTYIEITGYNKNWKYWKTYRKGIIRKKNYITKTLKANFIFIKIKLTTKQLQYVKDNMA